MEHISIYFVESFRLPTMSVDDVHFNLRILLFSELVYDASSFTHIPAYAELQWASSWKQRTPASEDLGSVNITGI